MTDAAGQAKAALRAQASAARDAAHESGQDVASRDVASRDVAGRDVASRDVAGQDGAGRDAASRAAEHFLAAFALADQQIVAGYRPIRSEIDPTPLLRAASAQGAQLCLPVVETADSPLRFRAWAPGDPLAKGAFGVEIPADGPWVEPDLVIVPLLAFDGSGARLGYGGGFYDRTLAGLRAARTIRAVGLAYAAQQVETIPVEPTDQRLDGVATENGATFFSR